MSYDSTLFNINPYYDDYNSANGFLRVLFRPGYAVQARELSQAQSILQNQVSRIGDHLFKDGSRIIGGGISVRTTTTVRITVASLLLAGITNYNSLVGNEISGSGSRARIVGYLPISSGGNSAHLLVVVDFLSGTVFSAIDVTLTVGASTLALKLVGAVTEVCKFITVANGIFYIDGFFVPTETQHFVPNRVVGLTLDAGFSGGFADLNTRVGYAIVRDTVTASENATLKDPAIGSSNYNAPGADRYKINLSLSQSGLTAEVDDFLEILRFESGKITKKSERITYAEIEKTLARRTYNESGSYIVSPFETSVRSAGVSLDIIIGTGKASVMGYELETQYPKTIQVSKARTLKPEDNVAYSFYVGNYIGVCMGASLSSGVTFTDNIQQISSASAIVQFKNSSSAIVASGYVHGAIPATSGESLSQKWNLYLYGITGTIAGASTGVILSPNTTGTTLWGEFTPITGTTFSSVSDANNQSLVYEITPGYALRNFTSVSSPSRLWSKNLPANSSISVLNTYYNNSGTTTFTLTDGCVSDYFASTNVTFDPNIAISDICVMNSHGKVLFPGLLSTPGSLSTYTADSLIFSYAGDPPGFTSGNLRVLTPIIYTPVMGSSSTSTRIKTSNSLSESGATSVVISDKSTITLSVADVYSVSSVVTSSSVDLTDWFELDDGQQEAYYGKSKLIVKPSKQTAFTASYTSVTFTILGKYFTHSAGEDSAPFVGATAYVGISYENIPLFTNPRTGKTVSLANCLDFRHSGITSAALMIKPYSSAKTTTLTYDHYLPRIDKLCLRKNVNDGSADIFTIQGVSDLSPTPPTDPVDSIVLGSLSIPAYTHNASDVQMTPYENRRYTMQDIGKMEKRIDEVEVFAKLSLSEVEIESRSLKPLTGTSTEPLKTSIFSEEFIGHSIGDVASTEYVCSIDNELGEMRPFFTPYSIGFTGFVHSNTMLSADGLVTLDYTQIEYIQNTEWTKKITINPSNTLNWLGFCSLTREISPVHDYSYRPVVQSNALGENDNWVGSNANNARGFGTQWNDWESMWTGIEDNQNEQDDVQKQNLKTPHVSSSSLVPNTNSGNEKAGIERTILGLDESLSSYLRVSRLKNRIKTRIGSRILDKTVVPYIPAIGLTLTVCGMKPASNVSIYFNGDLLKSGLSCDANGSLLPISGVSLSIPANTYLAGEKTIRISDSATSENATTSAEIMYRCIGVITQRDSGSYSVRPPVLRRQTVSSETFVKDPFSRDFSGDVLENSQWTDPLTQTFFVDIKSNPEGIFIKKVNLYFSEKDSYLPVTVQIRPTVNGYPSPCVVLPFSTTTVLPSAVNASQDTPTATVFQFSSPVFLEPGEYSLCVVTNSNRYKLYASDSGYNALAIGSSTSGRVGGNPRVGVLYTPTSLGVCVPDNSTNLMFSIFRCVFEQSGDFTTSISNATDKQLLKISASEIIPQGCGVVRVFTGNITTSFNNNENLYPLTLLSGNPGAKYSFVGNEFVSPVMDTQSLYGTGISMRCGSEESSYITRAVSVNSVVSNGIAVYVDQNTPNTSTITAFYRVSGMSETNLFSKAWTALPKLTTSVVAGSDLEYGEVAYGKTLSVPFGSYQVKIVLDSSMSIPTYHNTPSVRSIRAVSYVV